MTGGIPFGFLGLNPMPMPGPIDSDPGQMQLDDEQRRLLAQRLLGAQMFHPGSGPVAMNALADQDQDQGPAQAPGSGAGQGAPAQAPSGPSFDSPLAAALRGAPSMLGGQMPDPQMPAAPQQDAPQRGAPTPPPGIPSMIGAAFPQIGQAGGPQATGAIPQQAPQIAQARPPQTTAQPTGGDDDAAPADAQAAPAARVVPLPPQRPSDLSSISNIGSFDPLTGQPVSGSPQPVRGDFDPLTGQPVSGSPRPMGAPASPSPQGAPGPAATGGGQSDQSFMQAWRRLADSGIGDQLLAMSAGAFQGRTLGESLGKGLQNMLAVKQAAGSGDAQRLEYALKVQAAQQKQYGQNLTYQRLVAKGVDPADAEAAIGASMAGHNEALNNLLNNTFRKTPDAPAGYRQTEGGGLEPIQGGPADLKRLKDETEAKAKDETQTPLLTPQDRAAAGIPADDTRPAWIDPNKKVTFNAQEQTADIKNWQEAKRQGYTGSLVDYQNERARAGANATTINMPPAEKSEQSAIGTARASVIKEHIEAGRAARDKIQILDQMRGALDAAGPNMMTGPLGEPVLRAKQALGGMLGTQLPGTSATEMFANSGPVLAGAAARAITSRPAQIEFTTMLNAKPGLMNSPEGNRASMDVMRQSAVRDADLSDIAARSGSVDEFIRKRDEYEHAHPMINPFTGKPFGSATPAGPGPLIPETPAVPSRAALEAEARRRKLIQ